MEENSKPAKNKKKIFMVETKKKAVSKVKTARKSKAKKEYIFAVGRRKTATARVHLYLRKKGDIEVNSLAVDKYFPGAVMQAIYLAPLKTCNVIGKYFISAKISGSGKKGQLGALCHAMSRALLKLDTEKFRPILKKRGFLSRDPRVKERRKTGTGGKARRQKQSPKR